MAGLIAMMASGCATPVGQQGSGPASPGSGPTSPTTGYSQGSAHSPYAAPRPAAQPALPNMPRVATINPPQVQINPAVAQADPSVAQVGFFRPAIPASCNCDGCASGVCPPAAQGCLVQMPTGCNAFGIDPQEFICDGGDHPPHVTLGRDDTLRGLDAEDTIVHYTTEAGDIEIKASNRVCVYAPRFSSVRKITGALAGDIAVGAAQVDRPQGAIRFDRNLPGLVVTDSIELGHADAARRIDAMRERNRGVPVEGLQQPEQAADVLAALVGLTIADLNELRDEEKAELEKLALSAIAWALDEAVEVTIADLKPPTLTRDEQLQGFTIYEFPDAGRLRICKLADRSDALPGEIVNFAIRVENVGDSPVNTVVITDNLTTRLEYVEGSQTCSGGALFETSENQALSLKLKWQLTDQLRVGESVTIRFQCRLR